MPPVHEVHDVQPQLAVVPAQMAAELHVPALHESVVHGSPSSHAAQPLRTTRVSVIDEMQLVPAQVNVRSSWFWHVQRSAAPSQHA